MRKITFLILVLSFSLISCSGDDENPSSETGHYLEVTLLGDTYRTEYVGIWSGEIDECDTDLTFIDQSIGEMEKSNFSIDAYFMHYQDQIDFQGYNINNSTLWTGAGYFTDDCFNNLDVNVNFELDGEDLTFDTTKNNTSTIKKITKIEESNLEITYEVEGSFVGTFKKSDNTLVEMTGKYKSLFYTLK